MIIPLLIASGLGYLAYKGRNATATPDAGNPQAAPRQTVANPARPGFRVLVENPDFRTRGVRAYSSVDADLERNEKVIGDLAERVNGTSDPAFKMQFQHAYEIALAQRARLTGAKTFELPGYGDTSLLEADENASSAARINATYSVRFDRRFAGSKPVYLPSNPVDAQIVRVDPELGGPTFTNNRGLHSNIAGVRQIVYGREDVPISNQKPIPVAYKSWGAAGVENAPASPQLALRRILE